ncbi:MAG: redox-sensing transcriptional repressor Rex [Elusimicrobia bacterium]|nr:redox-sensing transcriptional repressor Rex [Elusimicrobiota bacterium]
MTFTEQHERRIPQRTIPRLSHYYRALLESREVQLISSETIAELTGYTAAQVRRDLAYFGQFGTPGRGYSVEDLKKVLLQILGIDHQWNVALIGMGNLGLALLRYRGFHEQGFNIIAGFDNDPRKVGQMIEGVKVHQMDELAEYAKRDQIRMAVVTVPASAAQAVVDQLVGVGVKAILNFAPVRLQVPGGVKIHNIDLAIELERLSFLAIHK